VTDNPDDRRDNVEKIQEHIDNTIHNIELADDMISNTSDKKLRKELQAQNERREKAVDSMKSEMIGEAWARDNGYE
jgi:small acid-soluble spore protein (thioredoxin-like protein)